MIKKLVIIAALALSSLAVYSQEVIQVAWAFNIGSSSANSVRVICEELNQSQNKYTFVLVSRPGAGGTIAANSVAASPNNTLVAMSSSFIIRPNYEKNEPTHNLDSFVPILVQGNGSPLTITSAKHNNMAEVYSNPKLTIGVSGNGSISHLIATEILHINKTASIVNFKSTVDAGTAAAGGHVDIAIGFDADTSALVEANKLSVIGRTGSGTRLKEIPDASKLAANYAIYAHTGMDNERFKEIHQMMMAVNTKPTVINSYKRDQLNAVVLNIDQSRTWYTNERAFWKKQVEKITGAKQ